MSQGSREGTQIVASFGLVGVRAQQELPGRARVMGWSAALAYFWDSIGWFPALSSGAELRGDRDPSAPIQQGPGAGSRRLGAKLWPLHSHLLLPTPVQLPAGSSEVLHSLVLPRNLQMASSPESLGFHLSPSFP
ncbi:hypothetical protein H1C71_028746 [Ictidomys tridecemlineatus]|nr:hypothetical protein H1C71_028746 [Ictidomys tridecemlineatus]KAG3259115.1 hypothetical protein H1C71_028746 [Ictidomys tridecemlineatus]KAG3259116.1 hypothetical protein H1C71_028746 [Ictidomys tridecemlineatus]KAG3259117.1 hypothetical protein H1C71_028746 [Ictidomys tridecemlineatus]KAG3259118.1 hypothetical protein H1C71_028746 [Ictidomys tridecemlineatus]